MPVLRHLQQLPQTGRVGVEAGEVAEHGPAGFVEIQGLDDADLAAGLLPVGLFHQLVQAQRHQDHLQRNEGQLVQAEDGQMVQVAEDQVMDGVEQGRGAEQQQDQLLDGEFCFDRLHGKAPFKSEFGDQRSAGVREAV